MLKGINDNPNILKQTKRNKSYIEKCQRPRLTNPRFNYTSTLKETKQHAENRGDKLETTFGVFKNAILFQLF